MDGRRTDPRSRFPRHFPLGRNDLCGDARGHDVAARGGRVRIPGRYSDHVRGHSVQGVRSLPVGRVENENWNDLAVGFVVSAIVAFIAVKWLLLYIQTHRFTPFAWYRIVFGVLLLAVILSGYETPQCHPLA